MIVSDKMLVKVMYELYVPTEDGTEELMERATQEAPLEFCFGIGMMLPKFEESIKGLKEGEAFDFSIEHMEAYGPYEDANLIDLDRTIFEVDGKLDKTMIFPGNVVPLMDSEGNRINAQIVEVKPDKIQVDLNHPLAGEDLHFIGKVLSVSPITEEELQKLMHGGGGCSGCSCSSDSDCESGCGGGCH